MSRQELLATSIPMPKFVVQIVLPNGDVAYQHTRNASSADQAAWVVTRTHLERGNSGCLVLRAKVSTDDHADARSVVNFYERSRAD